MTYTPRVWRKDVVKVDDLPMSNYFKNVAGLPVTMMTA